MFDLIKTIFGARVRARAKINEKLDNLDHRIDGLAISNTKIGASVDSLREVSLANQELYEQKLNNVRAGQENLKEMITLQIRGLEDLIRSKICNP